MEMGSTLSIRHSTEAGTNRRATPSRLRPFLRLRSSYICGACAAPGFSFCAAMTPAALLPSLSFSSA
jgi:hypothetical protein